mgnify:CR=1 FL=1
MKKNSLIFILNMIILLGLFSCSDNDEIDRSNQIQLYGEITRLKIVIKEQTGNK